MEDLGDSPPPRTAVTSVVALVGAIGVVVGFFLPWLDLPQEERGQMGFTRGDVERWERTATDRPKDEGPVVLAQGWLDGGSLDGSGWLAVLRLGVDHGQDRGIEAREVRAWRVAIVALRALPFAAGLLAALLLLGRLRPMSTGVLAACLLVAIAVVALAALVALGASERARAAVLLRPFALGSGLLMIGASGPLLLGAGLLGARRGTWWKAWLLALGLTVLAVLGTGIYVTG